MKKKVILYIFLMIIGLTYVSCENVMGPTEQSGPGTPNGVQARIGLNDNPASTGWDSALINIRLKISSALSIGHIVRREWKVYRYRTGQFLFADTTTILDSTYHSVDTLTFKLKVFGTTPQDTSSAVLNIRLLTSFGGGVGGAGDISLLSYTPTGTNQGNYELYLPTSRIPDNPPFLNPRVLLFNVGGGLTTVNLSQTTTGGWKFTTNRFSYDTLKFNYAVDASSSNIWSIAASSMFKCPGQDNAYTIKFIDGYIYNSNGGGSSVIVPGVNGDTVATYDVTTTHLIMYPNHRFIAQPVGQIWNETNAWDFQTRYHPEYGQTGYGVIMVPIDSIRHRANQVAFRFGGTSGVANMSASPLLSNGYLRFQFIAPNRPLSVGEEIELVFQNGSRLKLKVKS